MQSSSFIKDLNVPYNLNIKVDYESIGEINEQSPAILQDLKEFTEGMKILLIKNIWIPSSLRSKRIGSSIVNAIARDFEDHLIVTVTVSSKEDSFEFSQDLLASATLFFRRSKFVSINEVCKFPSSVPLLYTGNDKGKQVLEKLVVAEKLPSRAALNYRLIYHKSKWKEIMDIKKLVEGDKVKYYYKDDRGLAKGEAVVKEIGSMDQVVLSTSFGLVVIPIEIVLKVTRGEEIIFETTMEQLENGIS